MIKFLLSLSYDGSDYFGWVKQPQRVTIQGTLNQAIKQVIKNSNFRTIGASKTDKGVHALDQKVILEINFKPKSLDHFQRALNKNLPSALHLKSLKEVSANYHLPTHISKKTYLYTIETGSWSIHQHRFQWLWPGANLDLIKMQELAKIFIGRHNFQNFSGLKQSELNKINPKRQIDAITIWKEGSQIKFRFEGPTFIRYQIRMLVMAIIQGTINPKYSWDKLKTLLSAQEFKKFPFKAPAQGLTLEQILILEK